LSQSSATISRTEQLEDAVLERAPLRVIRRIAAALAPRPAVRREPGWFFDVSELDHSAATRRRRKIWRLHEQRRLANPITVRWYDGLKLRLYLGNDLSKCIYVGGAFEPNEFAFLGELLRPGMTFVDVGANDGVYTLFAARRVSPGGRVVAFEPSGREYDRLVANISLNRLDNVEALRAAVSDRDGEGTIAVAGYGHEGLNTLGHAVANEQVETIGHERVELVRLDSVLSARLSRLDVLKIDAEGAELQVLEGAQETLERFRPVMQLEVQEAALARQGASRDSLVELVTRAGYEFWVFDAESGAPRPASNSDEVDSNVLAAPVGWRPPC
jgi:FkbM family methyltransferase